MLCEGGHLVGGGTQVQHQIKLVGLAFGFSSEIDRACHLANLHAVAAGFAQGAVNLVVQPNRTFRANRQAGIAAGAQVKVNRVVSRPVEFERAKPAGE